jgi:hypothetical protein
MSASMQQTTQRMFALISLLSALAMADLTVDMPAFMGTRRRMASQAAPGSRQSKAAKVVSQAEASAAEASGGKPSRQNILTQLVLILTRMSLNQARDLAEITGALFRTFLLPPEHLVSEQSTLSGDDYQDMVKNRREQVEEAATKAKKTKKGEEIQEDSDDMDDVKEEIPQLPSPHVYIALQVIGALIQKGVPNEQPPALALRQQLKTAWDTQVKDKEELELLKTIKIYRGRKPQKQAKGQPKHFKLIICMSDPLQQIFADYLVATGAKEKAGQAPKSYLEREAAALMRKLNK